MRLESCSHFVPEEFIRKVNGEWKKEKQKYKEQLDALSELPAFDNKSGVRGSKPSDPTSVQAVERMRLEYEIEDIERCEQAYQYAISRLTPDEQDIIKGFFEPTMPMWKFVRKWEKEHYVGTTLVYKARRLALKRLGEIIEEVYDL